MERLNIQLLADGVEMPATSGGAAAPATADAQAQGQSAQVPAEQVQQGETFEALTGKGGKYEREYNAALQKAVRGRLRGAEAQKQRMDKMLPILSWVGSMYDVDMSDMDKVDLDALNEKIAQDNRWYEKESMETGIPVDRGGAAAEIRSIAGKLCGSPAAVPAGGAFGRDRQPRLYESDHGGL